MADMKTFLGYLVKRLTDLEIASLTQDQTASSKEGSVCPVWWRRAAFCQKGLEVDVLGDSSQMSEK